MFFSHGSNHSQGVLILISPDLQLKANKVVKDENGRYIIFKGELQGAQWLLGNCYFPTRDKEKMQLEFLESLDSCISQLYNPEQFLLLGGDFNTIMNGNLDYMGPKTISKTKTLKTFLVDTIWKICGEKQTQTKSNLHLDKSGRLFKAV